MEEKKSAIKGWRKIGIGVSAITAISVNDGMDFKKAVIIGIIAIIGIACQTLLDRNEINNHSKIGD